MSHNFLSRTCFAIYKLVTNFLGRLSIYSNYTIHLIF